jgi:hypothetical protein
MENNAWEITIGIFPGILFGVRTYEYEHGEFADHVLYLGIIDICFTKYNSDKGNDLYTG